MLISTNLDLKKTLKEVFGYNHFRGAQEKIINNILSGKNTFVIMPTGAGKSLCYQLPAVVSEGTAIVISPLIALMKNQVDQLNALGIEAYFLNSTLNRSDTNKVKQGVLEQKTKLLYVAPESLTKETNLAFFKESNISFIAIDEAHCISEWGHDFRPEYRKIRNVVDDIGELPIIALTATATPKVQQDIERNLQMENASIFKTSFNRDNLYYDVRPKVSAKKQLIRYLRKNKNKSGIIYCLSRKKVEEIAELLNVNDIKALPYHAGLDSSIRMANQDAFLSEDVNVIVATIAFGMGIDKPDVRFVIHYDAPKSLEGYYQETGRAGRDGLASDCIMFYSPNDIIKLEKFNKDKPVTERDNAKHLLREMMNYSTSGVCRRRQLLHYFGEYMPEDCNYCNNCKNPTDNFKVMDEVVWILETVNNIEQRFGIEHIANIIIGEKTNYVESYGHDKLRTFGIGKNHEVQYWTSIIRQVTIYGYLSKDVDNFGVLKISERGLKFLEGPFTVALYNNHDYSNINLEIEEDADLGGSNDTVKAYDEVLFEMLRKLRKSVADQKNLPPYVIFQDPSLEEMATLYPTTQEELAQVNGVGMGKVRKFGKKFITLIQRYVEDNEIETTSEVIIKTTVNKSKIKIFIIQQIDRKIDLEEIAESKNMKFGSLLDEIEHICYSGTRLNLDYYIDQILEEDRQEEIADYFMSAESDHLSGAISELGEEYSDEEIRLMRIKFMSEYAN